MRERVKNKQKVLKSHTDENRGVKEPSLVLGDYVRVKTPAVLGDYLRLKTPAVPKRG